MAPSELGEVSESTPRANPLPQTVRDDLSWSFCFAFQYMFI